MTDKKCLTCNKVKPLCEYHKSRKGRGGRAARCKDCVNKTSRRRVKLTSIKKNGEEVPAKKCTGCDVIKSLDKYSKQKTGLGGVKSKCKDCLAEELGQFNKDNPEYYRRYLAEHRTKNEARYRYYVIKRRTLNRNLPCDVTSEFIKELLNGKEDEEIDHFIPLSIGHGGTVRGNLITLPMKLNSSKNNRHPFEWAYGTLEEEELKDFEEKAKDLAKIDDISYEEFRKYVDWCFENQRDVYAISRDNARYGHKKKSIDIWKDEVSGAITREAG